MKDRSWTNAETEYLSEKWGIFSIPYIAKKLCRSVCAVRQKAIALGLGRHLHSTEKVTVNILVKAFGYDRIPALWKHNNLPVKVHKSIKKEYKVITIDEFWKWAEINKHVVDFSRLEQNMLGMEPYWVDEKRKIDFKNQKNTNPWTKLEDQRLKMYLEENKYTYTALSKMFNRTESAIKRRICTLRLKQRPIRSPKIEFTESEVKTLRQMLQAGHSFENISIALGRSALAIRGKLERIYNPDAMKRCNRGKHDTYISLKGKC